MDYQAALTTLVEERTCLDAAIRALENLNAVRQGEAKKRGRKFMRESERQEVSRRMKAYWAGRRKEESE